MAKDPKPAKKPSKPKGEPKDVVVSLRIPPSMHTRLKREAASANVTLGQLIRVKIGS
jgi:predicted HicB family RNase H-like nuclease